VAESHVTEHPGDVTLLLNELRLGNRDALPRLIPLVYGELRRLAAHYLKAERSGHTLQPTALVHQAYLRLVEQDHADWKNRAHFLGVAAQMMRRILVDYARARQTAKRDGIVVRVDLAGFGPGGGELRIEEILTVDGALDRLAVLDPQQSRVVELRYFAGLTIEETAEAVGISPRMVKGDWAMASAWLRREPPIVAKGSWPWPRSCSSKSPRRRAARLARNIPPP
jgi:RNA polymerase sigma factor (TIGR02999 family)